MIFNQEKNITGKIQKISFDEELSDKKFDDCEFIDCNFEKINITSCRFSNCIFLNCNLSLATIRGSTFMDVVFDNSKVVGINWTQAKWPSYKLNSPLSFYRCNISHSSFFELCLPQLIIESCKAHDTDFRSADLSNANLAYSDFYQSLFMHTNLTSADFSESVNYHIDIFQNSLKNATFSFPEAISLLDTLDIKIIGLNK